MHSGSRAFCILMALATTGSEVVSAAITSPDHYRVEATVVSETAALSAAAPKTLTSEASSNQEAQSQVVDSSIGTVLVMALSFLTPQATSDSVEILPPARDLNLSAPQAYAADGRLMASIADANEQRLLFVKTTRG